VSSGVPAAAALPAPAHRGDPTGPALRRPLLLACLAAAATLSAGLLPGTAGVAVPVAADLLAVLVVVALLTRWGATSAHPPAWRWYAIAVVTGAGGALLAGVALPEPLTALGSVPGRLLVAVALLTMIGRAPLRVARAQKATLFLLFVVADLLTVHTVHQLVAGHGGPLPLSRTVTLFALLGSMAVATGLSLVLVAVSGPRRRRVAWLLFSAQVATTLAGACSTFATGPGPAQLLACGAGVLGLALPAVAARVDVAGPSTYRIAAAPGSSTLSALLPHATAVLGGCLLLLSVAITGRLTAVGAALGGVSLAVLFANQTVSWRTQQRLTTELLRSEAYFRTLVRGSADPIVILDDGLRVRWVSPAITDLLGLDPARTVGRRLAGAVHPDDAPGLLSALAAAPSDVDPAGADNGDKTRTARVRHLDGRFRLIQARIRDLRSDPDVGALVLYCRDVTPSAPQPVADLDLAPFRALDPATGLPNRSALAGRLAATLRAPGGHPTSLVVLGVDGLPGECPVALRELTSRLARVLRTDDWLARSAVSEFAVLVSGSIADAEVVAARLVAAVEPLTTGAGTVRLTAAAGVSPLHPDVDAGEALRRGGLALRSARAAGPGRVRRHSDALRLTQDREEALRADLARALDGGQLRLVYQPVVDLALHRTTSVEALLRWRHPGYGEVSPAEFIPLAEESALIDELGRWVLATATATVAALPHPELGVAVNVSARHVRSGALLTDVLAALESSGLAPARLTLEITESVLLDDEHVTEELSALRRLGVRVAVDDFGTGWSSLAYLVGLPIDVLKMDRQFLADVETDPQRRALCSSVLHLGTSLGLAVVVEGVETRPELQLLRDMGHRYIQGFLLARPMGAEALAGELPADDADQPAVPLAPTGTGGEQP
jgi:PAS domain S-box-containing protein